MKKIIFKGREIPCKKGDNLRQILQNEKISPHNGQTKWFNCKGMGTCGTCAVKIKGEVSEMTTMEKWRLNFPPHQIEDGLRLACQCSVLDDLEVTKFEGFWGENVDVTK